MLKVTLAPTGFAGEQIKHSTRTNNVCICHQMLTSSGLMLTPTVELLRARATVPTPTVGFNTMILQVQQVY